MEETKAPAAVQTETAATQQAAQQTEAATAENNPVAQPEEKTVPKELYDKKISELVKENKKLKSDLQGKMTDDERRAAEQTERDAELQAMKNELAALKTESALTAAGISVENAKTLSEAIIGGDVSAIVEAVTAAIKTAEKAASAKTTKELLEGGSPKVQTAAGSVKKPDPNVDIVKKAVGAATPMTSKENSRWYK